MNKGVRGILLLAGLLMAAPAVAGTALDAMYQQREAQIERMRSHIEAVAGRYTGRIHAWDVVNEVIDNDGSYRPTRPVRLISVSSIWSTVVMTRAAPS